MPATTHPDAPDLVELLDRAASGRGTVRFADDRSTPVGVARLWAQAARVQHRLRPTGPSDPPRVAVLLRASGPSVATLLGIWRAGGTAASLPLPVRTAAPDAYGALLDRLCRAAEVDLVAVDPDVAALLPPLATPVALTTELGRGPAASEPVGGGHLVQCSSGTTSDPKGIDVALTAVAHNVEAILERLELGPRCRTVSWLPLSHDMGLVGMLLATLVNLAPDRCDGGELTLLHPEEFLADPRVWFRTLADARATVTAGPAFALARVLRLPHLGGADLSSLEALICGGERIDPDLLGRFEAAATDAGGRPGAIRPAYGMAEATLAVSITGREGWRAVSTPDAAGGLVTCGPPLSGTEVRIDHDGRIAVRSPSLFGGYVGGDHRPARDADGWFRTSDTGRLDGRDLVVAGRCDDVLVIRGRNVSALDLEATVARTITTGACSSVRPGAVGMVTGEDGALVLALEAVVGADRQDLDRHLRGIESALRADHGVRPDRVCLLEPGALPRTTSGKLRRHRLRAVVDAAPTPTSAP